MDIDISYRDPTPVYSQIADRIQRLIACRELSEGDELPSIRVLAEQLLVNPNTVARAYRELEVAGFLAVRRGSHTLVAATAELADATKKTLLVRQVDLLLADALQMQLSLDSLFQLISVRASETAALDDKETARG
jgi:GntR family transcriptional regulator